VSPRLLRGRGLAAPLALFLVLILGACDLDSVAKKVLFGLNELQDASYNALKDARAQSVAAGLRCGEVARAQAPPVTPSLEACKALGVPIPFDPEAVNRAITVSNTAKDAIRGGNEIRLAVKKGSAAPADLIGAVGHAIAGMVDLASAVKEAGVPFDDSELRKLADYWNGRTGP
jgi:hypothetical protein